MFDTGRWCPRRRVILLGFALSALLAATPVCAAIHTVTDLGDTGGPGQIRAVVGASAAGDTIILPAGTIVLSAGQLSIAHDLVILGASRFLTVIDGSAADRIFNVAAGAHVVIAALAVRNGKPAASPFVGGGIYNDGTLELVEAIVEDCQAESGGGIYSDGGASLSLQAVTVRGNSTYGITPSGGGIANWGTLTIAQSTISGNHAKGTSSSAQGGGIQSAATVTIVNSTISGNTADANFGGGIHLIPSATSLTLLNVTITDNQARRFGGGVGIGGMATTVSIANTIIAGNRATDAGGAPDCSGTVTSLGHNLVGSTTGCTIGGAAGDLLNVRARLAPLADNGGPTWTHALLRTSPAIDAGDDTLAPTFDQTGTARPLDGDADHVAVSDIGAFELVPRIRR